MYYHASRVAWGYDMSSSPGGDTGSFFFFSFSFFYVVNLVVCKYAPVILAR